VKWHHTSIEDFLKIFETDESNRLEGLYDIYYDISTAVFNYRTAHKLTQNELAEKLGVTQPMVVKYESGDYNFTLEKLYDLCQKLDLNLSVDIGNRCSGSWNLGESVLLVTDNTDAA